MKTIFAALVLAAAPLAYAGANCPETPKDRWLSEKEVQTRFEGRGYTVNKVKREGNCLEVHAKNKDGKRVEAYVNPADGAVVKEKVKS